MSIDEFRPEADDEYAATVKELAEQIEITVRGGLSIAAATNKLQQGYFKVPAELATAARAEYERRMRIIEIWPPSGPFPDDGGVINTRRPSWYGGPRDDDYFWPALRSRLQAEIPDALIAVDESSSRVVSLGSAPGQESIDSRGLVLGYVQSGKTTNFMSVIAKAADVGYRLIIVLSGITDNLRKQTQDRLDDYIVQPCTQRFHLLTTTEHDFSTTTNPNALLNSSDLRLLAIVKKNPARLRKLNAWLKKASRATLANTPILIVDDEADQASIDVGNKRQSTINKLIRELLSHPKSAYVAYTATPFANLLIDPSNESDLYPRDFIVSLPRPAAYFGAERIFGTLDVEEGQDPDDGLDIVRYIPDDDVNLARPPRNKDEIDDWVPDVPTSLRQAVIWFLIATTARRIRAGKVTHSSMLVHTSMRAAAHEKTADAIHDLLQDIRVDLSRNEPALIQELKSLWESETRRVPAAAFENAGLDFEEVRAHILSTAKTTRPVVDNYLSTDRLRYGEDPETVIVVGGNTLSRGLTLEGLISSFFVRASSAYDTLLQMGRWFGYRGGYEDLVRVWMTEELKKWFVDLATVEAEIRREIEVYAMEGKTPKDLPVRIRTHPQMAVTSAAKMKNAIKAHVSYSERRVQTILFHHQDSAWLRANQQAVETLVKRARRSGIAEEKLGRQNYPGLRSVPSTLVLDLLRKYQTHEDARSFDLPSIIAYVEKQNAKAALTDWNVVFITREDAPVSDLKLGLSDGLKLLRRRKLGPEEPSTANLKAIASTWDRIADIDLPENVTRESITAMVSPDGKRIDDKQLLDLRIKRGQGGSALLVVYPINKDSEDLRRSSHRTGDSGETARLPLDAADHLVGLTIFFPAATDSADAVDYVSAALQPEYIEDDSDELEAADRVDEERAEIEESSQR
ncbi:Z1 domain-containing protein [Sinomonas sp. G460-2]|uniref:Z1 domain-containing protein n=1 Tax=Sinomonas sp. G460-2 TaxID=3393464 RepID=UPI0039EF586E